MKKNCDLTAFEAELRTALKSTGHLFPTTDEEVEYFMAHTDMVEVPEKYKTPEFLFNEEFISLDDMNCQIGGNSKNEEE
jgi:hypothetical protein